MESNVVISKVNKKWLWKGLIAFVLCIIIAVSGISIYVGWSLTHPERLAISSTPGKYGLQYKEVSFDSRGDGVKLKGWLIPAKNSTHTVIFAHGYGKNRLQDSVPSLSLAKELAIKGYNVLLFDFRNSGISKGDITSLGQHEVKDLLGAVDFIKTQKQVGQHIALLGFSMGASTSIIATARDPRVEVMIADSPFADLTTYIEDNLPVWSHLPAVPFNQTIMTLTPIFTGLKPEEVSPIREISNIKGDILLIHGDSDSKIPMINSEKLLQAAKSSNKELVIIKGADHVRSYATDKKKYLDSVLAFLDRWRSR